MTKRQKKKLFRLVFAVFVVLVGGLGLFDEGEGAKDREQVRVERVVDGDTFVTVAGQRVRLIGIDTPETVHPTQAVEYFGKEASDYLTERIEGSVVFLEKDVSETDRYGRLLRYVYLEDGTFLNHHLVAAGYARVVTYPPDVKHQKQLMEAEREARTARRGLWSEEGGED